jgi:hypothetical protein
MGWMTEELGLDYPWGLEIFLFSITSRLALGFTQPPIQWIMGSCFPGVQQQRHEADHSPPSTAKVKNGGAISTPQYIFMSLCFIKPWDNFI